MEIKTLSVKRIDVNKSGLHILAIPCGKDFYRFQIQHDHFSSVLVMFGGDMAQVTDDQTLFALAHHGFNNYKVEYFDMVDKE